MTGECPSCHEPMDAHTLRMIKQGMVPPESVCTDCFHLHTFGTNRPTQRQLAEAERTGY